MSPRRQLVVTSTFPQFAGDARGAFLRHHWGQAAARGDHVRVLAPRTAWSQASFDQSLDRGPDGSLKIRRFAYAPRRLSQLTGEHGILENLKLHRWRAALLPPYFAALDRAIATELRRASYDRVAAHFLLPSGLAVARRCAGRVPFELYGHGTDVDLLLRLPSPARRAIGRVLSAAEVIYMPSARKRDRFVAAFAEPDWALKVEVEHMGHAIAVDTCNAPRVVGGDYVLFLGRLIRQKGVDLLLEAIARAPGVPLVIAGDGPCRAELEAQAQRLGADVRFVGWVQGQVKDALLRDACALAVPSRTIGGLGEGSPLVIAEAHAAGQPIVATDVGGIAELGAALEADMRLVPPNNVPALARELGRVFEQRRGSILSA